MGILIIKIYIKNKIFMAVKKKKRNFILNLDHGKLLIYGIKGKEDTYVGISLKPSYHGKH